MLKRYDYILIILKEYSVIGVNKIINIIFTNKSFCKSKLFLIVHTKWVRFFPTLLLFNYQFCLESLNSKGKVTYIILIILISK